MLTVKWRIWHFGMAAALAGILGSASPAFAQQAQKPSPKLPATVAAPPGNSALATKPCPRAMGEDWDNCNGVTDFENGDRYVGNFRKGLPDGIGTYNWKNGRQYFGEFKRGLPSGKGKFTDNGNLVYIGDFVDGRMTGQATVDYKSGAKYVGAYKDDRKNGKGTYTYANGDTFTGEFVDDEMTSNGVLNLVNGDQYSGDFKALKPQGSGTYIFKDGRKFIGQFIAGEPQGQGTLSAADGTVMNTGSFKGWDSLQLTASKSATQTPPPSGQSDTNLQKSPLNSPAPINASVLALPSGVEPSQNAPLPIGSLVQNAASASDNSKPENQKPASEMSKPQEAAQRSPVHCTYQSKFFYDVIVCDVVDDKAQIANIVFNRGKCPSAVDGFLKLQAAAKQDGANLTRVFRDLVLNFEDFRSERKFADRVVIPVVECANLLEFTVEANGMSRTWTTYE